MDCAHFRGDLTAQDRELLERLLERYDNEVMLKSWVQLGQVGKTSGRDVDKDKARAAEILRRRVFCWREKAMVSAVDVACAFWRAKNPEPRNHSIVLSLDVPSAISFLNFIIQL